MSERTWKSAQPSSSFDLLVPLLDPVPDAVKAHDFGQARGRVIAAGLARAAGAGQVGDQVPDGLVWQGARVGGRDHRRRTPSGPHPPKVASAAHQVPACPSRNVRTTAIQSPGSSSPSQASARVRAPAGSILRGLGQGKPKY